MTKGSLIEYQALKIAKLEQLIEQYRCAVSAQLCGGGKHTVSAIRRMAEQQNISIDEHELSDRSPRVCDQPIIVLPEDKNALLRELSLLDNLMLLKAKGGSPTGCSFRLEHQLLFQIGTFTSFRDYRKDYPLPWFKLRPFPPLSDDVLHQIDKAAECWFDLPELMYPPGFGAPVMQCDGTCVSLNYELVRLTAKRNQLRARRDAA